MQQQLTELQNNLRNEVIEGSAGNGLVRILMNGEKEVQKVIIQPECTSDLEGLQDLLVAAFQDASKKIAAKQPAFPSGLLS